MPLLTGREREGCRPMETVRLFDLPMMLSLRSVLEFQVKKKIHSSFRNVGHWKNCREQRGEAMGQFAGKNKKEEKSPCLAPISGFTLRAVGELKVGGKWAYLSQGWRLGLSHSFPK